jgi:hypothetical protein
MGSCSFQAFLELPFPYPDLVCSFQSVLSLTLVGPLLRQLIQHFHLMLVDSDTYFLDLIETQQSN